MVRAARMCGGPKRGVARCGDEAENRSPALPSRHRRYRTYRQGAVALDVEPSAVVMVDICDAGLNG